MRKIIELSPVSQTGHNCKITAIASIEKFYAEKLNFMPIPLHKNEQTHPVSIREIAKKKNRSVQGELLEIQQLVKILTDIGCDSELIDFTSNFDLFKK